MDSILENISLNRLIRHFRRAPYQLNLPHQSDAEILKIPGSDFLLAITTDTIVEEIEYGLYSDPWLQGYMTVLVNISDLAAVGAKPIGILLNQTFPEDSIDEYLERLQTGINDACEEAGTHVLGGDTNHASHTAMGATAIGIIQDNKPIFRTGASGGDLVYSTGLLGKGGALGLSKFSGKNFQYKPVIRLAESNVIRKYAHCCIDTSDGLLYGLDQLMRLNNVGFTIDQDLKNIIDEDSANLARQLNIPSWLLLNGPHGEFELLFTINPIDRNNLQAEASMIGWHPLLLGSVVNYPEIRLSIEGKERQIDTGLLRNSFSVCKGDIKSYVHELLAYHQQLQL